MEKITVKQAKAVIENAYGTIYSKEDVLAILDRIAEQPEKPATFEISDEQHSNLASRIAEVIARNVENMEYISGWDLSMNYNEVSVDSLEVNEVEIEEVVEDVIGKWITDMEEDNDCDC